MEEKLAKLILIYKKLEVRNVYIDIELSGNIRILEISIRNKKNHESIEKREVSFNNLDENKIDELIEFIKSYEEK